MVSAVYEHYCVEKVTPEKSVWKVLVQKEGGEEKALSYFRRQMHNMMLFFADVEGRASESGIVEVMTEEGKEKLKGFATSLLSGGKCACSISMSRANGSFEGNILKFVREKAHSVGLAYTGGTGRFEERIKLMTLTKKKAKYEREHGYA